MCKISVSLSSLFSRCNLKYAAICSNTIIERTWRLIDIHGKLTQNAIIFNIRFTSGSRKFIVRSCSCSHPFDNRQIRDNVKFRSSCGTRVSSRWPEITDSAKWSLCIVAKWLESRGTSSEKCARLLPIITRESWYYIIHSRRWNTLSAGLTISYAEFGYIWSEFFDWINYVIESSDIEKRDCSKYYISSILQSWKIVRIV